MILLILQDFLEKTNILNESTIFCNVIITNIFCDKTIFFSGFSFDILETCECIPYLSCPWAKKTTELISKGVPLTQLFKVNICNYTTQSVWCCENSKGQSVYPKTNEELKILVRIKMEFFRFFFQNKTTKIDENLSFIIHLTK